MIVVSNTSPLTNPAAIGQFDLLSQLYGEIQIATGWIKQHTVHNQDLIAVLLRDFDRGEAETLA
jgi:uncharacterized protein